MKMSTPKRSFENLLSQSPRWTIAITPAGENSEPGIEYQNGLLSLVCDNLKFTFVAVPAEQLLDAVQSIADYGVSGFSEGALNCKITIPAENYPMVMPLKDFTHLMKLENEIGFLKILGPKYKDDLKRLTKIRDKRLKELDESSRRAARKRR